KPVQIVSAISERLSRLYPSRYMMPNVPINESGTTTPGIKVARRLRRNRNTTRITSAIEMHMVTPTSCTEARMVVVRSRTTERSIAGEIEAQLGQRGVNSIDRIDNV